MPLRKMLSRDLRFVTVFFLTFLVQEWKTKDATLAAAASAPEALVALAFELIEVAVEFAVIAEQRK